MALEGARSVPFSLSNTGWAWKTIDTLRSVSRAVSAGYRWSALIAVIEHAQPLGERHSQHERPRHTDHFPSVGDLGH